MGARLLVLGWHNVAGTHAFPAPVGAGERGFARQMEALSHMANVVPLEHALERLHDGGGLPKRAVALTFDDGYADNLTFAVPVLERLGLPATFFLVPRFLSGRVHAWWETLAWAVDSSPLRKFDWDKTTFGLEAPAARRRAYTQISRRLKLHDDARRSGAIRELVELLEPTGNPPKLFMDWDGARGLLARGFTVQAHTCTHPVLSHESDDRQRSELADSRRELEEELGTGVSIIAYPHGGRDDYDQRTTAIARDVGYSWGVTTREGFALDTALPLEIPRCVVYPERGRLDLIAQLRYIAELKMKRGAQ